MNTPMLCERCGKMKPGAYGGIREPDFCKCDATHSLARLMAENERLQGEIANLEMTMRRAVHAAQNGKAIPMEVMLAMKKYAERNSSPLRAALKGEPK